MCVASTQINSTIKDIFLTCQSLTDLKICHQHELAILFITLIKTFSFSNKGIPNFGI